MQRCGGLRPQAHKPQQLMRGRHKVPTAVIASAVLAEAIAPPPSRTQRTSRTTYGMNVAMESDLQIPFGALAAANSETHNLRLEGNGPSFINTPVGNCLHLNISKILTNYVRSLHSAKRNQGWRLTFDLLVTLTGSNNLNLPQTKSGTTQEIHGAHVH